MEVTQEEIKKAINIAMNARKNAFVIKSFNPKGACIITTDSKFYGGCNIQTNISGLGICAERCAIDHAIVNGQYEFKAYVLFDDRLCYSCGMCLQYVSLFTQILDNDISIISATDVDTYEITTLSELLPKRYIASSSLDEIKRYRNKKEPLPVVG